MYHSLPGLFASSSLEAEREQARKLGCQINREARRNRNSPYAAKMVGILRGEVVMVFWEQAIVSIPLVFCMFWSACHGILTLYPQ